MLVFFTINLRVECMAMGAGAAAPGVEARLARLPPGGVAAAAKRAVRAALAASVPRAMISCPRCAALGFAERGAKFSPPARRRARVRRARAAAD